VDGHDADRAQLQVHRQLDLGARSALDVETLRARPDEPHVEGESDAVLWEKSPEEAVRVPEVEHEAAVGNRGGSDEFAGGLAGRQLPPELSPGSSLE
jgi:hypothetical protein